MTERDWRKYAYLRKENWPKAIPWTGPKREYGPFPWGIPDHDPHGLDAYPSSHPDAASVGETYMGDVCPYCGVPLDYIHDEVRLHDGTRGLFHEINEVENPEVAYHVDCWNQRRGDTSATLEAWQ